jgi:hypothetical protein
MSTYQRFVLDQASWFTSLLDLDTNGTTQLNTTTQGLLERKSNENMTMLLAFAF